MKSRARNHIRRMQRRKQDPRSKMKMRHSRRDFQMAGSVVLEIMINALFLSCFFFQCQLCPKEIRPPKPSYFRKHLLGAHPENMLQCQWPECNYVRTLIIFNVSTLLSGNCQTTASNAACGTKTSGS